MLLDIGVVFAAYAGFRLYENYRKSTKSRGIVVKQTNQLQHEKTAADETETQQHLHYMKMSAVSMGFAAIRNVYPPMALISLGVFTYTAIPYLKQVEQSFLKTRKLNGYVLYGIADMMTLALGRYVTAAFAVGLLHTARFIVTNAQDRSKKMLINVFDQQSHKVWVLKNNVEIEVPIETVQSHDIIVVNTGEAILVDGFVADGVATVDQHTLTGESQPVEKWIGEQVFASTVVITGRIYVQVEKSGQETTIAKIGHILNHSIDL
jgi:Cu2+-exporting ATPase